MERTQFLVHRWGAQNKDFGAVLKNDNHNSVSSVAQARHILDLLKTNFIFRKMSYREQVNYFEESACPKGRHC